MLTQLNGGILSHKLDWAFLKLLFLNNLIIGRFISNLAYNISRPVMFNTIMLVRTSPGVRPTDFLGSFYLPNTTDMELASVNR